MIIRTPLFGGNPLSKTVTMTYSQGVSLGATAGAGVTSSWSFRANSIFDPDQTGVGHQPIGSDQWAVFYNHYIVLESAISITFYPASENIDPLVVGCLLHEDGTITTPTLSALCEQGSCVHRGFLTAFGCIPVILKARFSARTWFGHRDPLAYLYTIGAAFGSNPSDMASFVVFMGSHQGSAHAIHANVQISYKVHLSEPLELVAS